MPICIAGMHRSGTSMVARILRECDVWLGDEGDLLPPLDDNQAGFFEHAGFVGVNDDLLSVFGGAWDLPPPLPEGWERDARVGPIRERAAELIREVGVREPWAWKDPRNSLTLPFWRSVVPDLRVIVCIRQPLEVAKSLTARAPQPRIYPLDLWLTYNQCLLDELDRSSSVVTHYDSYFHDSRAEIRRLLLSVGLPAGDDVVTRSTDVVNPMIRHHRAPDDAALALREPEVASCYRALCAAAGPVYQANAEAAEPPIYQPAEELELLRRAHGVLKRRVLGDRTAFAEQVQALRDDVERLSAEVSDLRQQLDWREEITVQREEALRQQAEELTWRTEVMERQESQLNRIYSSRAYRYAAPFRRLRAAFGRPDR